MADGPLSKSSAVDEYINMLKSQYQANQPSGPLSQIDPLWMGAAQGFLAPTRTGSFAESMGSALSGVQSPLQSMRQQQMSALEKIANIQLANQRLQMEAPMYSAKAARYEALADNPYLGGGSAESRYNAASLALDRQIKRITSKDPDERTPEETKKLQELYQQQDILDNQFFGQIGGDTGAGAGAGGATSDGGAFPKITNDAKGRAKYNSLAPGSSYMDPEGNIRTKPAGTGERG